MHYDAFAPGPESAEYIETLGWDALDDRPHPFHDAGSPYDAGWNDTGFSLGEALDMARHPPTTKAAADAMLAKVRAGGGPFSGVTNAVRAVGAHVGDVVKRVGKVAGGAVKMVRRGLPAVAKLISSPAMLAKTVSASGFGALRALATGNPKAALGALQAGASELSQNPAWTIAQSGASFIPGVGQAVSSGMAAAAALGRGESIKDIALDAARGAIPGGPLAQAAFDTAVGVAKGGDLSDAALGALREQIPGGAAGRAAFDAGVTLARRGDMDPDMASIIRDAVPPEAKHVYDGALAAASNAVPDDVETQGFSMVSGGARQIARALHRNPEMWHLPARRLAEDFGAPVQTAQRGIAALLSHWHPDARPEWHDVGAIESTHQVADRIQIPNAMRLSHGQRKPRPRVTIHRLPKQKVARSLLLRLAQSGSKHARMGLHKFGVLAKTARDTGELTAPTVWTIRSGDLPVAVAQKLTGRTKEADGSWTWKGFGRVNPGMNVEGAIPVPWQVGQQVNIPPEWVGAPTAPPPGAPPGTPPKPGPYTPPPLPPGGGGGKGGPPFRPPSKYPNGYPGSTYTTQKGDLGSTIAEKITGDSTRWPELVAVNPGTSSKQYGMVFGIGQNLALPGSWQAVAVVSPPPISPPHIGPPPPPLGGPPGGAPPPPKPTPGVFANPPPGIPDVNVTKVEGDPAQVMIIAAELSSWLGRHPEVKDRNNPVFGTQLTPVAGGLTTDTEGHWDNRIQTTMQEFQTWANQTGQAQKYLGRQLNTDGLPTDISMAVLQAVTAAELPGLHPGGGAAPPGPPAGPPGGRPPGPAPGAQPSTGGGAGGLLAAAAAAATLLM